MTTIYLTGAGTEEGRTESGRPVQFCRSMWCWIYSDTPADQIAQKIEGQVFLIR